MASATFYTRLSVDGEKEFRRLADEFHQAARGGLQKQLRDHIRATAAPILNELRAAVTAVEVSSTRGGTAPPSYSRQLRQRVAAALRISVAYQGVQFGAHESSIGPYGAQLAKYLDSSLPGYANWRHPVFSGPAWTVQHGQPWFFVTIEAHASDFERACWEAVQDALRSLM